ncbi:uncharacterized protein EV420DRAFT_1665230 [Desarmillaria tabescens]|uniref:Thioester reductase (TE) domain-containing protein n=1 Tax=Armillaria tabescens TaxID=1929756 RepID=A0AA39NA48_ARMTA|nr:uncharacterized protein EV420DRAFT_1665230 [Desarmillaria tabescens]KAK0461852.1 hypothetical protein EV420DRAFT_1665230 [Desarmillaria tabescens]
MSFSTHRTIPPPPQKQGEKSTTFRSPPIDGSFTLQQMYDWHLVNSVNHRIFIYARDDGSIRTICWPEAIAAIYTGARLMKCRIPVRHKPPVVAILSMSDTITYFTTMMSLLRANFIFFPISPRNSALAVAHLLHKVGVQHVLVGRDVSMQDLARASLNILKSQYSYSSDDLPDLSPVPVFEELFLHHWRECSTAYPKPIPWSGHRVVQLCLIPWFGGRDLCNVVFSLHVMPMYHGMGVLQLFWTASSGLVVSAFEPKSPALLPTPDNLFVSARAAQSDVIFCVPSFIEVNCCVVLYHPYLMIQCSGLVPTPRISQVGYDWDYFKFPQLVTPEMVPSGNDSYELVMVENEFFKPSVINTKVDGKDAYATSDLFIPHPTKAGFWKIFGRTDDQIMHNTGEKNMLNQDPHVMASVFFGRGMFQAGVLIEPKTQFAFDPEDESKLAEFRNKIWLTVERINRFAPQHSRLFKEMILVAKPRKPFTYTAKNTARRQAILDDYSEEITAVYKTVEESTQANIPPPLEWDDISTKEFVRTVVFQVLSHSISEDDDLFQHGCDRLATWIRNTLLRALRDTAEFDTRRTTDNFVYSHPSISQLATFLHSIAQGTHVSSVSLGSRVDDMRTMVSKYSKDFLVTSEKQPDPLILETGKVILLTGTTGALGCHILASLVLDQTVGHIYAVNRPGKISRALINHGIDINMEKVTMLEVDLSSKSQVFPHEVRSSVTHIIHNAWRVDFNLGLSSFESNIRGLRNLIEVALASQARLIYTSSIGVFQNAGEDHPLAETHVDPYIAQGTGYSESKWVSEELLRLVPGLRYLIVRVGQLAGGPKGTWNPKEWVPSMIQSSTVLGFLPDDEQLISWLPVHVAAQTITNNIDVSSPIMHLVHPNPVPWAIIARIISRELNVNLVSYTHWLEALENLALESTSLPATRLLPHYRRSAQALGWKNREAFGLPHLVPGSYKGKDTPPFDEDEVGNWLRYWRGENMF